MMKPILWLLLLLLVGSYLVGPVSDPDLWWHLVVGEWILSHGSVPHVDYWNTFAQGNPWQAYSWSNEVLYATAYLKWGAYGLLGLKLILAAAFVLALGFAISITAQDAIIGLLLALPTAAACHAHFDLRPQVLSWLFFAVLLALADNIKRSGWSLTRCIVLVVIMAAWANSHITTVIGIGAAAIWLIDPEKLQASIRRSGAFASLAFAATFLTPYLGSEWLTLLKKADHPFLHMYVVEFQPSTLHHAGAVIALLLFALYATLIARTKSKALLPQSLLTLVFIVSAFAVQKFIPFSAIASALSIAKFWQLKGSLQGVSSNLEQGLFLLQKKLSMVRPLPAAIAAIGLAMLCYANLGQALQFPLDTKLLPVDATNFIEEHLLVPPFLNTFNEGGYLLYRLSDRQGRPKTLVPLDGRTNINDPDVVKDFLAAFYAKPSWRGYFEKVKPNTILWPTASPLVTVLLQTEEWCNVYPDPGKDISTASYAVFVSRSQFDEKQGKLRSRNCK